MDEYCPMSGVATLISVRELQVDLACQAPKVGKVLFELLLSRCLSWTCLWRVK